MEIIENKFDFDDLTHLIRAKHTIDDQDTWFIENSGYYCSCSEELQGQGKCECGFEDERERFCNKYKNALETVADNLLREHGLMLAPYNKKRGDWIKKIVPVVSWKEACSKILETLNGIGDFYFNNSKALMDSGPYVSYKQTVLNHLGIISRHYLVYGGMSSESKIERMMRY